MIFTPLFSVGGMEWIWLVLIAIILLFGAKKLPELARSIGRATGEFQKGRADIEKEIRAAKAEVEGAAEEMKEAVEDVKESLSVDVPCRRGLGACR